MLSISDLKPYCGGRLVSGVNFAPWSKAIHRITVTARFTPLSKGADGPQASGGIFLTPMFEHASHVRADAMHRFLRVAAGGKSGNEPYAWHGMTNAGDSAFRVKIPPLGLSAESAPFDKGVNAAAPSFTQCGEVPCEEGLPC